jgi:hypothetical protein
MAVNIWQTVNTWASGGGGGSIPASSRGTIQEIYTYLLTQGYSGNLNDVLTAWLSSEGHLGTYNDKWLTYLRSLGYTGSFSDIYASWREEG